MLAKGRAIIVNLGELRNLMVKNSTRHEHFFDKQCLGCLKSSEPVNGTWHVKSMIIDGYCSRAFRFYGFDEMHCFPGWLHNGHMCSDVFVFHRWEIMFMELLVDEAPK